MPCFNPRAAYRLEDGSIRFGCFLSEEIGELQLPCGECDGCRLERSRQWAVRCMHEAQLHEFNCFVTLTYDDDHLPEDCGLHHKDFQKFMKRLRKTGRRARFFMCGEYGATNSRPHFHACLFNVFFADRVKFNDRLYTSVELSRLWPFGFSSIGDVTFESAAYIARYTLKKVGNDVERLGAVDFSTGEICVKNAEYARMSLRPAIAREWYDKYSGDIKRRGDVVCRGRSMRPPRYYDKLLGEDDPDLLEAFKFERLSHVRAEDGTPERLRVQEIVCKAGLALKREIL